MTPAERLRAAADTIERTANDVVVRGGWRVTGDTDEPQVWSDEAEETVAEICTLQDAAHVALWDPPTALLAAEILRTMADRVEQLAPVHVGNPDAALAFADHILGGAS